MKRTLMGLMLAALLSAPGLEAQEIPVVQAGDMVRVLYRNLDLQGTLLQVDGDSILLQSAGGERSIHIGSGEGLYIGMPRTRGASARRRMAQGALVGGLIVGIVSGFAALAVVDCFAEIGEPLIRCESEPFHWDWVVGSAATLGVVGAIWGALRPGVAWRPAVLPARELTLQPTLSNHGFGFSAKLMLE